MGKINKLGKRYGKLLVIDEAPSKGKKSYWKCKCDCGNIIIKRSDTLIDNADLCCPECSKQIKKKKLTKNMIGQKIGNLLVIEQAENNPKRPGAQWKCQCDCGIIEIIHGDDLRKENGRTCCMRCSKKNFAQKMTKDIQGQKFGHLTVLRYLGSDIIRGGALWECQCECGNVVQANGSDLRYGHKTSCGCISINNLNNYNDKIRIDLVGQKFGNLTVIKKSNKITKNFITLWTCQCECGKIIDIRRNDLVTGNTTSCGCKKESHGEQKIKDILNKNHILFETQKSFQTCRFPETHRLARFDFYVNNKYLIEYDGIQHYKAAEKGWNNKEHLQKTQEHDQYKNEWCKANNISLIRIPYTHYNNITLSDLLPETSQFLVK